MRQRLLYQFLLEADNEAGRVRNLLHIKQPHRSVGTDKVSPQSVMCAIGKIVLGILYKLIYVLLFMYIPYRILSKISVAEGFQLRQSVVYFTSILSCICGSLINSGMFDVDEDAHALLDTMQVEPSLFFKERMVYKLIIDAVGFILAFSVIGIDFGHAFYLMIWILISRLLGEFINLYVFRYTGRIINEIPVVTIVIMGTCVFMAYAFPFLRNRVVDLTVYLYNYIWLLAGLVVASVVLYELFNYDGYAYIAKSCIARMKEKNRKEQDEDKEYGELAMGEYSADGSFKEFGKDKSRGLEYLHKIFFSRNLDYVRNIILVRCILIIVAAVVGIVLCRMSPESTRDIVWSVLCAALPIMVFIMYWLSVTPKLCKLMFCYMDLDMFNSSAYRSRRYNFRNYMVRLRILVLCELIQAVVMCICFIAVAVSTGNIAHMQMLIPVCTGIILLSVFYAVFNLLVYYMCQPYTVQLKTKGYTFYAAHAGMLAICYGCVYINCSAAMFDIVLALVLAVMLSGASALVYYFSNKTFNVR